MAGLTLGALAAAVVGVACRSLPKQELERRLLALEKNRPVEGALTRRTIRADLGEGAGDQQLILWHAPARAEQGNAPVVLVHGTPSTLFSWSDLVVGADGAEGFDGLRETHDVYAIEVIGHGIAPGDAAPYGFERCARFVAAAVRALALPPVHLVGQSYGGEFAWRAALNEPALFRSLTIVDSSGVERREGDWLPEEEVMRENSLAGIGWALNSRARIERALAPHFREIPPDRVEEFFLVCENAHNWKAMVALARDENGTRQAELPELRTPTLVLWGADDLAYPPDHYARAFADAIPDATLVTLPETGHYPHEERPAAVARELRRFWGALEEGS